MPTSPGPLQRVLDDLWARLRLSVPDLPPARLVVSPSAPSTNHAPERWHVPDPSTGVVTGLVIGAQTLTDGPDVALETILHEAAHILCWRRGINDTARRGQYHNGTYLAAADEVGLHWPDGVDRHVSTGYSTPRLTDETRATFADLLGHLADAIDDALPHLAVPQTLRSGQPDRIALQCECKGRPRKLWVSRTTEALGPIICGVCESAFTKAG